MMLRVYSSTITFLELFYMIFLVDIYEVTFNPMSFYLTVSSIMIFFCVCWLVGHQLFSH